MGKVCLLSLGCPKNLVDSETLLRKLADLGVTHDPDPDNADILLINTCGFIEAAKRESVDEILRLAQEKGNRKLLVFGCLAKRHGEELQREIPEIDALFGVGADEEILSYCSRHLAASGKPSTSPVFSDTTYAYLKIAEGCNRGCTYCVIPSIRGQFRSFSPEAILKDAERLIQSGRRELILVAQDITSYGREFGYSLERLVREISTISGDFWVRLLYLYPSSVSDDLLEVISSQEKVCKYLDIPLQHTEENILRLMKRGGSNRYHRDIICRIRAAVPGISLRTTLITGFPQETDRDFEAMLDFVREMAFDHLGVFSYSREEGSPAYSLKGQVPLRIRTDRRDRIMQAQAAISLEKNLQKVGQVYTALIDEADDRVAVARLSSQAPEIDGVVYVRTPDLARGSFTRIEIVEAFDYDLAGTVVA